MRQKSEDELRDDTSSFCFPAQKRSKISQSVESVSSSVFPVHRWIKPDTSIKVSIFDSSLPQQDVNIKQRENELELKRQTYTLDSKILGAPLQVGILL